MQEVELYIQFPVSACCLKISEKIDPKTKVRNLEKKGYIKTMLKDELKLCDFNMQNYKFDFEPSLVNQDETVESWISRCDKSYPTITLVQINKKDAANDIDLHNSKTKEGMAAIVKIDNAQIVKMIDNKYEAQEKFFKSKFEAIEKSNVELKQSNDELKQSVEFLKNAFNADKNIHKLSCFIYEFRQKMVDCYNELKSEKYENWSKLSSESKKEATKLALEKYKLNGEYWKKLAEISGYLNEMKHKIIDYDQAINLIDQLTSTEYEDSKESFRNLVEIFKENKWYGNNS